MSERADQENRIGPYELRGELGRGAMAHVWRGWDPNLEREVAIKEPLFDHSLPQAVLDEMGRRFVAEGRAAARLSHPGIVTVFAANVWDGRPAIVMELIKGSTLSDLLAGGALPPAQALAILDQLLDAIGYAHERGVIHRDIKPDNIFVTQNGQVKLADFGIAHVDGGAATHATMAGTVLGTPGYMSPEQARGTDVDARSDLFSVGVIAHEMLTGRNPFGAGVGTDSTTLLYRIVHEPAPELPESTAAGLPADLRPAIMAALSKDPAGRPPSAAAFKAMLHGQAAPSPTVPLGGMPQGGSFAAGRVAGAAAQQRPLPSWLPYAAVGGVCALGVVVALVSALGSPGGGAAGATAAGTEATESAAASQAHPYLAIFDGRVAIYGTASDEPIEVTEIAVSDLSSEDAAALGAKVEVASLDEAEALVEDYRERSEEAQEERAEEEARKAEEEARKAASSVEVTITGADGRTRTETIHRDGASERVFPDSNTRLLSESEVNALSDAERCIAWNEIIAASNGYVFMNSGLSDYFYGCSWYRANPGADGSGNISGNAAKNVNLLKSRTSDWWLHLATY